MYAQVVGSYGAGVVASHNQPPDSRQRRRLWPLWATIAVLAVLLAGGAVVALYLATKPRVSDSQRRAAEFAKRDPYGSLACVRLDVWMNGMGLRDDAWYEIRDAAHRSTTDAIWEADTAEQLHAACVAAGSPIGPHKDGPD